MPYTDILRQNCRFAYRRIDLLTREILEILEILGLRQLNIHEALDLEQSEELDLEQSEQEYWGNVRALEVLEGFYNDTQVTSHS